MTSLSAARIGWGDAVVKRPDELRELCYSDSSRAAEDCQNVKKSQKDAAPQRLRGLELGFFPMRARNRGHSIKIQN